MLHDIKNTVKQSVIYGLSRISSKLISFILLPLYSITFSVSEYGVIVRIETLWQILWALFLFGLESGIVRWFTQIEDTKKRKTFLFSVTAFVLILNALLVIGIYFLSDPLSFLIFGTHSYSNLVWLAALIAILETIYFIFFLLLRINEKATLYAILAVATSLLNLVFQYYFISYTNIKIDGIFISKIISPLVIVVALLPYYMRHISIGFEKEYLKELIKYSFPIMLATLVSTLLNQSDRYILGYLTNSAEVGIYGLGYNICGLINLLIISPFTLAFSVISWKKLKDDNAKRFYTKNVTYLFFAVIYFSIAISLFTPHVIKVLTLNTDYWKAKDVVPWIAFSIPFYGIQSISIFSFYVTKNTKYILYFYISALAVNVAFNFLLIPYFKMYGAAISNFISFLFLSLIFYLYSKKEYYFKYEWYKMALSLILGILLVFPFFYFQINSNLLQIILKLIALGLFPFLLIPFGFYEPVEIDRIKGFVNKYLFNRIIK